MTRHPLIHTARLVLRKPTLADGRAILERFASDPEVTRYMGWPKHRSVSDTRAFLIQIEAEWDRWPAGPYLIALQADGSLLGSTGLSFENPEVAVTGYVLAKDAWGKGYATEALAAMVALAASLGVRRLYAHCHAGNKASQRVLEKNQFISEGLAAKPPHFPNLDESAEKASLCYARELFTESERG